MKNMILTSLVVRTQIRSNIGYERFVYKHNLEWLQKATVRIVAMVRDIRMEQ